MAKYLGEKIITEHAGTPLEGGDLIGTPFEGFTSLSWVLTYVESYGQFDGAHHKQWVLDQIARIVKGTPVKVSLASWDSGLTEYRYDTGEPSQEYNDWVVAMKGKWDEEEEEFEYSYDEGIAP